MRRGLRTVVDAPAEVQVPIPAMLDMTFQLLSFFVLTFNPPGAGEGQMDLQMPSAGAAKAAAVEQADPFAVSSREVEPAAEIVVVVGSEAGRLGALAVRDREATTPVGDLGALREELIKLRREFGRANVQIEAAGDLRYAQLVEVMDACLAAKFDAVGFAPPRP
jgi:biopolymer transport protein ExbD